MGAACLLAVFPSTAATQGQSLQATYTATVDRPMTIAAGTADLLALQRALAAVEDRVLPPRRFDETTRLRRALGVGYRLAKLAALDLPQDHFVMVAAHEVFGHGARLREIGAPAIGYRFDAPIPYGDGGGSTRFLLPERVARAERVSIATAGLEAQTVLASTIGVEALARGVFHHREAWLYVESRLAGLGYIRSVSARSREGHDVAAFLHDLNAGCEEPSCRPLGARGLKRSALLMLADPLLASAAYGVAVSYLVQGRTRVRVPLIPLPGDLRYLPAVDFSLTPYGTEWSTSHHVLHDGRLTSVAVRVGQTGRGRTWGAALAAREAFRRGRLAVALSAALWRQPPLDASPTSTARRLGGLATATVAAPLGRARVARRPLGVVVQAGAKTEGYAPGERLRAGPIVRVGLTCGAP